MFKFQCLGCGKKFLSSTKEGHQMFCSQTCERNWLNSDADCTIVLSDRDFPLRTPAQPFPLRRVFKWQN